MRWLAVIAVVFIVAVAVVTISVGIAHTKSQNTADQHVIVPESNITQFGVDILVDQASFPTNSSPKYDVRFEGPTTRLDEPGESGCHTNGWRPASSKRIHLKQSQRHRIFSVIVSKVAERPDYRKWVHHCAVFDEIEAGTVTNVRVEMEELELGDDPMVRTIRFYQTVNRENLSPTVFGTALMTLYLRGVEVAATVTHTENPSTIEEDLDSDIADLKALFNAQVKKVSDY